jgi:hypothetical protein
MDCSILWRGSPGSDRNLADFVALLRNYSNAHLKCTGVGCILTTIYVVANMFALTLGKLLPQAALDSLMADHFATFVTDDDLDQLRSTYIESIRIPVSYNTFIPEANRTDIFPSGEFEGLNR